MLTLIMPVEIKKHSYLQIENTEQQRTNRKWNYDIETYSEMMNEKSTGWIVGATPGPHKVKKKISNCKCRTPTLQSWSKQKQATSTNRSNCRRKSSTLQSWTKQQQATTDEPTNQWTINNHWTSKHYMYLQWLPNCSPSTEETRNIWRACQYK